MSDKDNEFEEFNIPDEPSEEEETLNIEDEEVSSPDSDAEEKVTVVEEKSEKAESKAPEKKRVPKAAVKRPAPSFTAPASSHSSDMPFDKRTILVMILACLVLILVLIFAFAPAFRVSKITVNGNVYISTQDIYAQSGIEYGSHIFAASGRPSLSYMYLERIMKENNPYIERINIHSAVPGEIIIDVTERQKIAYIGTPDGYAAIDSNGIVLELCSEYNNDVRPIISGISVERAVLGQPIEIRNVSSFQKMVIVLGAILAASENNLSLNSDYVFFDSVIEVRSLTSGYFFVTLYLPDGPVLQVKFDSTDNIINDMNWLVFAIESGGFENLPSGVLDMTGEEYIYREYQ